MDIAYAIACSCTPLCKGNGTFSFGGMAISELISVLYKFKSPVTQSFMVGYIQTHKWYDFCITDKFRASVHKECIAAPWTLCSKS